MSSHAIAESTTPEAVIQIRGDHRKGWRAEVALSVSVPKAGPAAMREAISYKRFSTPRQARGESVWRQTDLTEEYCRRHRLRLVDTYLDAGLSGFSGGNLNDGSALRALLQAARMGRFKPGTRLIVESLDRLTRREISTAVRLFLDLLDTGLVIVTLIDGEQLFTRERVDTDLTALIIVIVFLSRANNESRSRRERALHNQRVAREKARSEHKTPITAECPRWLTLIGTGDNRHFVVDRDRARVVEHVFRLAASGLGQLRIVRYLNGHQVPTLSGRPKWRPGMIGHLLHGQAVLGVFHPCLSVVENGRRRRMPDPDGPIEGYFPAIVSKELYDKAQRATRSRLAHRGRRVLPAHNNLVGRIGRCAMCNGSLYLSQTADGFAYLRCVNVRDRECGNRNGFPYRKLEAVLLALDMLTELVRRVVGMVAAEMRQSDLMAESPKSGMEEGIKLTTAVHEAFLERFAAAKTKIGSEDPEERLLARRALVDEFRSLFEGVVLHPHRVVTLHAKPDAAGHRVVYAVGYDGVEGIQVKAPEGTIGLIDASVLAGIIRPVSSGLGGGTSGKITDAQHEGRARNLHEVLASIRVNRSANGDWQAVAHDPMRIMAAASRGEGAFAGGEARPQG